MERGVRRGPGRPRGTPRGGGGSSSSGRPSPHEPHSHSHSHAHSQTHSHNHPHQHQSAHTSSLAEHAPSSPSTSSHNFNLNFSDNTSIPNNNTNNAESSSTSSSHIQARTPSSSRGRVRLFSSAYPASSTSSSPAVSASFPARMDVRTPRSEKLPKSSQLHHSFTFSTPTNSTNNNMNSQSHSLRKRARTFEFGLDGAADDESEVKGGHSLRKRARVDYAQIGDEVELTPDNTNNGLLTKSDAKMSSTAPSARGRKRRANEIDYDADDLPPSTVTKKRGRFEKQRTESPASSRRKQPQRKTSTQSKTYLEQQPSDTELKDTIEVGVQYSEFESSDEQSSFKHSDTASVTSERPNGEDAAETVAPTHQEAAEPQNIVSTITHSEPDVFTSSNNKPVKAEVSGNDQPQDASNHIDPVPKNVDPVLSSLPQQQPATNAASPTDASAHELVSASSISVSKPNGETEKQAAETDGQVSTESEQLKVVAESDVARASQEATTKPLATQLDEPTITQAKVSPKPQTTESVTTPASPVIVAVTEDAATEKVSSEELAEKLSAKTGDKKPYNPDLDNALATLPKLDKHAAHLDPNTPTANSPSLDPSSRGPSSRDSSFQPELPPSATVPEITLTQQAPHAETNSAMPVKTGRGRGRRQKEPQESETKAVSSPAAPLVPGAAVPERDYSHITPYVKGEVDMYPAATLESGAATPAPEAPEATESFEERSDMVDNAANQAEEESQQKPDAIDEPAIIDQTLESTPNLLQASDTPADSADAPSPSQDTNGGDVDQATPDEPVIEAMRPPKARKQFPFPRITDPQVMIDALKEYRGMSDEQLFLALADVTACLETWQNEWQKMKTITDDEDNAARRRTADASYEGRLEREMKKEETRRKKSGAPRSTEISKFAQEREFIVRGIRAKEPTYQNDKVYHRAQDQIMAQAYGFEYDPKTEKISRQEPLMQRNGLSDGRLRNRPKQSQRAAEAAAEEPAAEIIPGRRTRQPRKVEDQSESQSRADTPVEPSQPSKRGRRRGPMPRIHATGDTTAPAQSNGDEQPVEDAPVPKKRGRRPGPKAQEAAAALAAQQQDGEKPKGKKRGRRPKAETIVQEEEEEVAEQPKPKRQRVGRGGARAGNRVEIPTASFYDNASPADTEPTPTDESRPTTSSSSGTAHTAESNYSFRGGRRKNYTELANMGLDAEVEQKPKRGRRAKKEPEATPQPSEFNPAPAPAPATGYFPTAMPNGPALAPAPPRHPGAAGLGGFEGSDYAVAPRPSGRPKIKLNTIHRLPPGIGPNNPALAPAPLQFPPGASGPPMNGPPSRSASVGPSKAPSRRATPAPSAGSSSAAPAGDSEKDYASMTKSEKMSASMKARWANGSMQRAVDKRKETLARKKERQQQQQEVPTTPAGVEMIQPAPPQPAPSQQLVAPIPGGAAPPLEHAPMPFAQYMPAQMDHLENQDIRKSLEYPEYPQQSQQNGQNVSYGA